MLFRTPALGNAERRAITEIEEVQAGLRHHLFEPGRWHGLLRRSVAAGHMRASTGIEGHHVTRDDAVAAVDGAEPFEAADSDWAAVVGYRDAMDYVLDLAANPHLSYSDGLFFGIHRMMMKHDHRSEPGRYRSKDAFVGRYECPDPDVVPDLMGELIVQLNNAADTTHPMVRAAMAHLNLLMIHPFKDGNGRMSRALQTLVLGREGTLDPAFSSIEEYLGDNTPGYYRVLEEVGGTRWCPERDARPWIRFVLTAHLHQARELTARITEAGRVWNVLYEVLAGAGLDERNMDSLFDAAMGYRVRRHQHIAAAEVSERVASADLRRMVDAGLLRAVGERRGRYYVASEILLRAVGRPASGPRGRR